MTPTPRLTVYADESCLGNQYRDKARPGGAAGLIEYWDGSTWSRRDYWLSEPDTTNNRMALRSAIDGIRSLKGRLQFEFVSDSQYLVKGMSEWLAGWKRRGWKRKAGPIENLELWQELDRVASIHQIRWRWVKGHAGHPQNEYANDLAIRAAEEQLNSDGLVPSGFADWLESEREAGRYQHFMEFEPPS